MINFEKILVCVDLSSAGQSIIGKACSIAKKAKTKEVAFLYVVKEFNFPESLQEEFPDLLTKAMDERKNELKTLINEAFTCSDEVETKLIIKQGNLTKEILTTSAEEDSDLIVIGRKQDSDSILNTRIARRAACNLMIVPRSDHELSFDRIHVPVDFSNYTSMSLDTALTLSEDQNSEIFLHNVYTVPSSYRYSGKTFEEFAAILEEHTVRDLEKLTRKVTVKDQKLTTIHSVDNGQSVIDIIYDAAKNEKADIIVMGAKGRTAASALFIGSKAERMIQVNENIPLLVVRPKGSNAGILESLQ
ncbi:MAG: universal stress protein, partial [Bacteroidota bacterium]